MAALGNIFAENPRLELIHLKWEFNYELQRMVPQTVKFLKICLFDAQTQFLPLPVEPASPGHHLHGRPAHPQFPVCFQTVRALAVESQIPDWEIQQIPDWRELLPRFSKSVWSKICNFIFQFLKHQNFF
jgi:hypothetical protein